MVRDKIFEKPRDEWERLIFQWVYDAQAREILRLCLLDGISYEKAAEMLDISRATVYNKVAKWSPRVFEHCD